MFMFFKNLLIYLFESQRGGEEVQKEEEKENIHTLWFTFQIPADTVRLIKLGDRHSIYVSHVDGGSPEPEP